MSTRQFDNDSLNQILTRLEQPISTEERVNYLSTIRQLDSGSTLQPRTLDEFNMLNPNASSNERAAFLLGSRQTQAANNYLRAVGDQALQNLNRDETLDVINPLVKGTIGLGQITYGAADLLSRLSPAGRLYTAANQNLGTNIPASLDQGVALARQALGGEKRGLAQNFQQAREISDELFGSDVSQEERQAIQANQAAFAKESDAQTEAEIAQGKLAWYAEAKNIGRKAANTVEAYLDAPGQIIEETIEQVPQLLLGAGSGTLAAKSLVAGRSPEVAKRFLNSKAGQKQLDKFASAAGVGTAAISEAMSNAVETRAEVEKLKEAQLAAESPYYNKLREQGLNHEQAKLAVADRAFDIVTALTLPLAAASSKVTGAGKLEGTLFTPKSKLGKSIIGDLLTKPVAGAVREGIEETLQSGGGQFIQNLAVRETAKESQSLTENVGEAIGQGAVVGAGSGLTLGMVGAIPKVTGEAAKSSIVQLDKVAKEAAKVVERVTDSPEIRKAVETGNADALLDTEAETYAPEKAYTVLMKKEFIPVQDTENNESDEAYKERVTTYANELKKHVLNQRNTLLETQDDTPESIKEFNEWAESAEAAKNIISILNDESVDKKLETIFESKNDDEVESNKQSVLGSMDLGLDDVSIEQATKLLESDKLNEQEKAKVNSYVETAKAYKALSSLSEVNKAVLEGTKGFLGLKDYRTLMSASFDKKDEAGAKRNLDLLNNLQQSYADKSLKFREAFKEAVRTNETVKVKHNNKNYNIHKGSIKLIQAVASEAVNVAKVNNALREEFNANFPNSAIEPLSVNPETTVRSTETKVKEAPVEAKVKETTVETKTEPKQQGLGLSSAKDNETPVKEAKVEVKAQKLDETVTEEVKEAETNTKEAPVETVTEENETKEPFKVGLDLKPIPKIEEGFVDKQLVDELVAEITAPNDTIARLVGDTTTKKKTVESLESNIAGYRALKTEIKALTEQDLKISNEDSTADVVEQRVNNLVNRAKKRATKLKIPFNLKNDFIDVLSKLTDIDTSKGITLTKRAIANAAIALENFETNVFNKEIEKLLGKKSNKVNDNEISTYILPSKNNNVLNVERNFIDNLEEDNEYGIQEVEALKNFKTEFKEALNNTIRLDQETKYLKNNLVALTIDADKYDGVNTNVGDALDDNIVDAMALAALKWLGARGKETLSPDESFLKRSLGLDDDAKLPAEAWTLLKDAGMDYFVVEKEIGRDIFNSIGFKINPEAPLGTKERFINSLGAYVIGALHDLDGLKSKAINANQIHDMLKTPKGVRKNLGITQYTTYDYLSGIEESGLIDFGEAFLDINTEAFDSVFKMENPAKLPSFSPIKKVPTKSANRDRDLSKADQKSIEIQQKQAVKINTEAFELLEVLGEDFVLDMEGRISDTSLVHKTKLDSVEGKNDALKRSYDNLKNFVTTLRERKDGLNTPFYFSYRAISNNRTMINSNRVNFQGDKLHRHLMYMDSWNTTVDTELKRDLFMLAIGQAFNVDIDKQTLSKSLEEVNQIIKTPEIIAAVGVLRELNKNKAALKTLKELGTNKPTTDAEKDAIKRVKSGTQVTEEQKNTIKAALKIGKHKSHTFAALTALMNYSETEPFQTKMFLEVDGVTNGTAIALMQMASYGVEETLKQLEKVGIYTNAKTYGEFKREGGLDNYETLSNRMQDLILNAATELDINVKTAQSVGNLLGKPKHGVNVAGETTYLDSLFGLARSVAKNPVMIGNYGAGVTKILGEFAEEVIDSIYTKLTDYSNENDQAALTLLQRDIENVLGEKIKPITVKNAKQLILSEKQLYKIRKETLDTLGLVMEVALENEFGAIIEDRSNLNALLNITNDAFIELYDEKVRETKKANKRNFITIQENLDILKDLERVMPKLPHAGSDDRASYLNLTTEEKRGSELKVTTKYKNELKNSVSSKTGKGRKQVSNSVEESYFAPVGVKGVVLGIQSTDAANMNQTFINSDSKEFMNIFDAVIAGIGNITEVSNTINKAMFDNSVNYSLYDSFYASMEEAFKSMNAKEKLVFNKHFSKKRYVNKSTKTGKNILNDLSAMESNKKEVLDKITNVRQYNLETSGYSPKAPSNKTIKGTVEDFVNYIKEEELNILGSSPNNPNKGYSGRVNEFEVNSSNIQGILNGLRHVGVVTSSSKHHAHLVNLLGNLYNDLINPIKVKQVQSAKETSGFFDIAKREIQTNINNNTRVSSIEMGADEVLAHEMIHAITQVALEKNNKVSRQVAKLFRDAKAVIEPEDLMGANGSLKDAKARYNYIFNNPNKTKGTNYSVGIHEFVAMGVTNEQFMNVLASKLNREKYLEGNTLLEKIFNVYLKAVQVVKNLFDKSAGISNDRDLVKLVYDLATYEEKGKQKSYIHQFQQKLDSGAASILKQYVLEPLVNLSSKDVFRKNDTKYVGGIIRGASALVNISAAGRFNEMRKAINKVAYRLGLTENNLIVSLLNEMAGRVDENNWAFELARESNKLIDQTRAEIASNVQKHLTKVFSKELSAEEEVAITKILLDTDLAELMVNFNSEEMLQLIADPSFLYNKINEADQELNAFGTDAIYYRRMSKSLANFMVTGRFTETVGLTNAKAIASLAVTGRNVPAHAKQAEKIIDKLASLEALRLVSLNKKKEFNIVRDLAKEEFNVNPVSNGILFTLGMMQEFKTKSLKELFHGNKMLTVKGYRKEIFDPNKGFVVAKKSELDELVKDGFVLHGEVPKDPTDPNSEKMYLLVNDNAGLVTWMAGGISTSRLESKGTGYFDTMAQVNKDFTKSTAYKQIDSVKQLKEKQALDIYAGKGSPMEQQTLVPILDEKGDISNFRYLMKDSVKDEALNRDERFTHVLGATEGNFISKVNGKDINKRYVEAIYQDYTSDYVKDPSAYVFIGETAEGEYNELWKLMPSDMQNEVRRKFNKNGLYVKRDLVKVIFGQRKFSLNVWAKEKQKLLDIQDDTLKPFLSPILGLISSKGFGSAEQMWKELVTVVKDTVVIKSISVLIGNVASNNILLWTMDVPVTEIASRQAEAVKYAEQYQADRERVLELEREISVASKLKRRKAYTDKLRAEKATLEDSLERNPVKDLIDSGIYQSIIEDVELVNDEFNYKTKLENWVSPITDKVPSSVKKLGKYAVISQDTEIYKFLRRSTQLSDFAARYALHKTNLDNGMSREASLNRIEDVFVNYDLPTHKGIQYLNDVGGLFFTKFFLRIQKIIYHTMVNSPARVLGLTYIQDLFGNLSDIADSSIIFRDIFNMFNVNPLEVVDGIVDAHPMINIIK